LNQNEDENEVKDLDDVLSQDVDNLADAYYQMGE